MKKLNYTDMLAYLGISSAHPGGSLLTKRILATENLSSESEVLDIGCGTGQTAALLAMKYNCSVTALDAHSTMVNKAKKRFANNHIPINVLTANVENLPFEDNTFDYVISESVIAFTKLDFSLPECNRVLKPGGRLIAIEMITKEQLTSTEKAELHSFYGIEKVFSVEDWRSQLSHAGFEVVLCEKDEVASKDYVVEENDPSSFIDPSLFEVFEAHCKILNKYGEKLAYCIFRCQK